MSLQLLMVRLNDCITLKLSNTTITISYVYLYFIPVDNYSSSVVVARVVDSCLTAGDETTPSVFVPAVDTRLKKDTHVFGNSCEHALMKPTHQKYFHIAKKRFQRSNFIQVSPL